MKIRAIFGESVHDLERLLQCRHVLHDGAEFLPLLVSQYVALLERVEIGEERIEHLLVEIGVLFLSRRIEEEPLVLEEDLRKAECLASKSKACSEQ
jgi:hypothetical protein